MPKNKETTERTVVDKKNTFLTLDGKILKVLKTRAVGKGIGVQEIVEAFVGDFLAMRRKGRS